MAKEYIEREAAIDIAMQYCPDDDGVCSKADADLREMLDEIEAIPTADVVEVVRCKDCKYYYAYPDEYRTCHEHYDIDGASQMMATEDFCSKGERRGNDEN